jgi:hypothetical protein
MQKTKYKLLTILCLSSLLNADLIKIKGKNGVVLDTDTKLMWQDDEEVKIMGWFDRARKQKLQVEAIHYCPNLRLAEYDDWQLPDKNSLETLFLKKDGLQNVDSFYSYWSSSTENSWMFSVNSNGDSTSSSRANIVRCVRNSNIVSLSFFDFIKQLKTSNQAEKSIKLFSPNNTKSQPFLISRGNQKYFGTIDTLAYELLLNSKLAYTKKPFEAVQQLTQEFMNPRKPVDITSRIPKEIVKPIIPNEILKPILPTMPVLVKGEFETKAMFEERVVQTANERQFQINKIQEQYRQDVEARNQTIEKLSAEYKEKVKERNQQLALLQKEYDNDILAIAQEQKMKKENPAEYIDIFNKISFLAVMKSVDIKNASYDAETETMYVTVKATNADFEKKASFKVPLADAKEFKENLDKQKVEMTFDYKNSGFVLNNIAIQNNMSTTEPKTYVATLTTSDFKPETVKVALKDTKVDFKAPQGVKLALQNEEFKLSLQNPNLTDKYQVQALGYGDSNKAKGIKYNNDLTPMIKNLKAEKVNSKKWLFVIAIENYDEADAVTYAKNSAEDFVKVAQKRLGISERNTYSLIDDKATSGSIKDRLDMMLKNVKDGDSVYFYYSGHGIPNPNDGEAYILPKDKIVDYVTREKEFMVRNIYKQLSDSQASKIVAFMDSCFSGNTDGISNIKGVAATRVKTKKVEFDKDKMVVLTAGTANQFSNMYKEKGHRLFSYFLTKAMIERPNLDVDSIYKSISVDVKDESFKMGDLKVQEPQMEGNNKIEL